MKNFILLLTLIFSFSCSSDEFEKEGYESRTVIVDGKFNAVAILNLFSILGWGIDAITNSLKVPDTRVYQVTLKEK